MSKMIRLFGLAVAMCAVVALVSCKIYDPKKDITTLFITGNYQESRLLTDLIQNETDQPYLLIPNALDKRIYFVPSQRAKDPRPREIPFNQLGRFVRFTDVNDVCILGDARYVPQAYVDQLNPNMNIQRISNNNWIEIAKLCQKRYNLNNLASDYRKLHYEMKQRMSLNDDGGVRMGNATPYQVEFSEPAIPMQPKPAPVIIEEETVTEVPVVIPEPPKPDPVVVPVEEPIVEK